MNNSDLPDRDPGKPATEQGLFFKYIIQRKDGQDSRPGQKHWNCDLFVLDVSHDPHAKVALAMYASHVEATHPQLAADMRERYGLKPVPLAAPAELLDELIDHISQDFFTPGMIVTNDAVKKMIRAVVALMLTVQKKHDIKRLLGVDDAKS